MGCTQVLGREVHLDQAAPTGLNRCSPLAGWLLSSAKMDKLSTESLRKPIVYALHHAPPIAYDSFYDFLFHI